MKINRTKLKIATTNACMNQKDLARESGITEVSISQYFSGRRNPSMKNVGKIAKALNVPVTDIVDIEE